MGAALAAGTEIVTTCYKVEGDVKSLSDSKGSEPGIERKTRSSTVYFSIRRGQKDVLIC